MLPSITRGQNTLRPGLYFQNQYLNYYNPAAGLNSEDNRHEASVYGKHKFVSDNAVWYNKPVTVFSNYISRLNSRPGFYSVSYINDSYSFYNRSTAYIGYT